MHRFRCLIIPLLASAIALATGTTRAVSPKNPYRSFNLSGINYGSMQWEKAQRRGKGTASSGIPVRPSGRGPFRRR